METHDTLQAVEIQPTNGLPADWLRGEGDGEGANWEAGTPEAFEERGFFSWPVQDHFRRKPFHTVSIEGEVDVAALVRDYRDKLYRSNTLINRQGQCVTDHLLFDFGDSRFGYHEFRHLTVYAPTPEASVAMAAELQKYVNQSAKKTVGFRMLSARDGTVLTEFVKVQRPLTLSDETLALHYGSDFPAWEMEWINQLIERPCGVSVLFGPPGCGKTTYLRSLMGKLIDDFVFYFLPVSEFHALATPALVSFWVAETRRRGTKQKIVILEDAEDLLLPREQGHRDKVSNLLNIGDGFLGDHLKLHLVATTNVPMRSFDPAVTRPGRLMGSREFSRLKRAEAEGLAAAKGIQIPEQADYSLAEIYCHEPVGCPQTKPTPMGFGQPVERIARSQQQFTERQPR